MMALLDRLMAALDVRIDGFAVCEVCRGWRLAFDPEDAATAHYGLMGSGVMRTLNGPSVPLSQHSFLILPPRLAHSIEAPNGGVRETRGCYRSLNRGEGLLRIQAGAGDSGVVTACGTIRATYGGTLGLFDRLDEPVVESFAEPESLRDTFRALLAELAAPQVGTRALTEALLKQCLVLLLRRQLGRGGTTVSWLAALKDPRLTHAIAAMLERPAEPFTLEALAKVVGMSRSAFAEHFSAALGQPPMDFLMEVRLRRAARLLEATDLPVKVVAQSVGYASRSYFSRAFSKLYGANPTAFRTNAPSRASPTERGE